MTEIAPGLTRRTALTALGATGAVTMASAAIGAPAANTRLTGLERASEALRLAMVAGDGRTLDALLHDRLVYMHSSGHSQSKADLMRDLAGKQFFAGLTYAAQSFDVVGDTGIVRLTVDQVKNVAGGKTRASRIEVLHTWVRTGGTWRLLGRVSALIESPLMRPSCPPAAAPAGGQ